MIVLFDCETTGLHPTSDPIIEIGMLAVTDDLQTEIACFCQLVRIPEAARARCGDFVTQMHATSGLWNDYDNGEPLPPERAEQAALDFLAPHGSGQSPLLWGGSGVNHYDSAVLAAQMPRLRQVLKYRADYDVSPVRGLATLAGVPEPDVTDLVAHRALPDCRIALRQLQTYLGILRSHAAVCGPRATSGAMRS